VLWPKLAEVFETIGIRVIFQSPFQVLPGYKDILAPALFPVAIAAAERAYLRRSSSQIAAAKAERDD
jgi:hypothetical protein